MLRAQCYCGLILWSGAPGMVIFRGFPRGMLISGLIVMALGEGFESVGDQGGNWRRSIDRCESARAPRWGRVGWRGDVVLNVHWCVKRAVNDCANGGLARHVDGEVQSRLKQGASGGGHWDLKERGANIWHGCVGGTRCETVQRGCARGATIGGGVRARV